MTLRKPADYASGRKRQPGPVAFGQALARPITRSVIACLRKSCSQ